MAVRWSEARAGAELADFLDELRPTAWPTYRQFRHAGRGALRRAIDAYGGARVWSEIVGLPVTDSHRPAWDERRVHRELEAFLAELDATRWPSHRDFHRTGRGTLLQAITRHGGTAEWADRFGLERAVAGGRHKPAWPDARLEGRLRELLAGWERWPTTAEWVALDEWRLLNVMHGHPLGTAGWARRLGLPHPRARPRRGPYGDVPAERDADGRGETQTATARRPRHGRGPGGSSRRRS